MASFTVIYCPYIFCFGNRPFRISGETGDQLYENEAKPASRGKICQTKRLTVVAKILNIIIGNKTARNTNYEWE